MAFPSGFKTTIACGIRSTIRLSSCSSERSLVCSSSAPVAVASSWSGAPRVGAGFRSPLSCCVSTCRLSDGIAGLGALYEISVEGQRIRTGRSRPNKFVRADQRSEVRICSWFLDHGLPGSYAPDKTVHLRGPEGGLGEVSQDR